MHGYKSKHLWGSLPSLSSVHRTKNENINWCSLQHVLVFLTGRRHEEVSRRGLRRRRQPDLLQREHGHVARRCQEDLRRTSRQAEGALRSLKIHWPILNVLDRFWACCNLPYKSKAFLGAELKFFYLRYYNGIWSTIVVMRRPNVTLLPN